MTSINIPKLSTIIGDSVFSNCSNLVSIDISNAKWSSIYSYPSLFNGCVSLTSVNCSSLTSIYSYTFNNCRSLLSIYLPNAVSLTSQSFVNCSSLTSLHCPQLTSIYLTDNSNYPFDGCDNLISMYVSTSRLSSIGNGYGDEDQVIVSANGQQLIWAVQGACNISNDAVLSIG